MSNKSKLKTNIIPALIIGGMLLAAIGGIALSLYAATSQETYLKVQYWGHLAGWIVGGTAMVAIAALIALIYLNDAPANRRRARRNKVNDIMRLAGVAPADMELAAKNYERLSNAEIDRRLAELRSGAKAVEEWRQSRGE